jgi:hypothetical protein
MGSPLCIVFICIILVSYEPIQCQNPVAKKIKLTQYCAGIEANFIISLNLGEVQTLKYTHKFFQDFLAPCCVACTITYLSGFGGLTRIRKFRSEMPFHSLSLHSFALTRPHMPKGTSHMQPSRLFWWDRPPEGSTHWTAQICLQPPGQRRCALLPVVYTD